MDPSSYALIWLPLGLGLLGFIEPCTIGGHLIFLDTQVGRAHIHRAIAVLIFTLTRSLVTGLFGALVAFLGQHLIAVQTGAWLIFGGVYFALGLTFLVGRSGLFKWNINLAPSTWKRAQNPIALGLVFGTNIPACAAPILFGLLALATTTGTVVAGFAMMFLFGLALSFPLIVIAIAPKLTDWVVGVGEWLRQRAWLTGGIFVLLGGWSIWFGLSVDPANWAGT